MGFRRKTYRLKFTDPALDGLEVVARGATVEELAYFASLSGLGEALMQPEHEKARRELFEFLARKIVSWNLEEEDGTAIPVSADSLAGEDATIVLSIMFGWADAVGGVSAPLAQRSSAGEPSEVASLPMETLLPNPPS